MTNGSLVSGESLPGGRMYQAITETQLTAASSSDDYGRALDLKSSVDAAMDQQLRSTLADASVDAFGFELAVTPTSAGGLPFDTVGSYPAGTTDTLGLLLLWLTNTGDSNLDVAGSNPELFLFARCPSSGDCTTGAATSIEAPRESNATVATFFESAFIGSDESKLSYFEWISDSARSLDGTVTPHEFGLQTVVNPASNDPETVIRWKGSADWLVLEDDGSGGVKAETMTSSTIHGDRLRTLFGLHGSSEAYVSTRNYYEVEFKSLYDLSARTYGATITRTLLGDVGSAAILAATSREVQQVGGSDTDFEQHDFGQSLGNPSSVVVFVHGWQNTASSALDAFATARTSFVDAGYVDPVVGFSWPSDEINWYLATELARRNGSHLAGFLDYYSSINASGDVHVVAHSLGAQVVLKALKYGHDTNGVDASVQSVSFLGAAANPAEVASGGKYHEAVREEVGHFYNYYNPGVAWEPLKNRILDGEIESGDLQRRAGDDVSDMILDLYYEAAEGHRAIGVVEGPDEMQNYTAVPVRDVPTSPISHSAYFYPDEGCIDEVVGDFES